MVEVETSRAPTSAALQIEGLTKSFFHGGRVLPVLDGVTLSVPAGGWTTVIGPSGCGKTTLLRIAAGLVSADSGRVVASTPGGEPFGMAYMPQADTLLPWRTALENVLLGAQLDRGPRLGSIAEARSLFERFGLARSETLYPQQLSGGMRQRVALLRTFLFHREVLLLDEPLGSLDALTRASLQEWLLSVWQDLGRSVLLVTHDVEEAILLSDRITVLSAAPAHVRGEFRPEAPRPRRREDDPFVALKAEILSLLFRGEDRA